MKQKLLLYRLTFLLLIQMAFYTLHAQDPGLSQFYANSLYTNPAFTGTGCHRIAAAYRLQYYGLPGGFTTFNAAFDQRVDKIKGGYGIMFTHDVAGEGVLTANHLYATYAYEWLASKEIVIRLGMQAGFFQKTLQWDKLRWGDQIINQLCFYNPVNVTRVDKSINAMNFATGALLYSKKFYAGMACHNITEPNQSFFESTSKLPRRYTLHGGYVFNLDSKPESNTTISPNILLMSQGKFFQMNIGFYANRGAFVAGCWLRQTQPNADAVIALVGYRKGNLKLSFSTDFTISNLRSAGKTAFEFTTIYQFTRHSKGDCKKGVQIPSF